MVLDLPLEDRFVYFATCDEILVVLADQTVANQVQMISIALIVGLAHNVWVVEKTNCT